MQTKEFAEKFLQSRKSKRCAKATIETYEWVMNRLVSSFPGELPDTPGDLMKVLNYNAEHLSASSLNTILARIRIAYKWGVKQGIISTNPAEMIESIIEREEVPRYLEEEEIERLLAAAANDRDFAILALLLDSGMRVGELEG